MSKKNCTCIQAASTSSQSPVKLPPPTYNDKLENGGFRMEKPDANLPIIQKDNSLDSKLQEAAKATDSLESKGDYHASALTEAADFARGLFNGT